MISVVIPVFNKKPHLERAIDSVLNQTYSNIEIILVDDSSTDGSYEVLLSYTDPRVKVLRRTSPGPGGYAARNFGVEKAKFDWISFLDADDEWELDYLETVISVIAKKTDCELVATRWDNIYSDRVEPNNVVIDEATVLKEFSLIDYLNFNHYVWTSALTVRKALIQKVGLFPEGRCKRGGDMDTWIRCLNLSNMCIYVNQVKAHYYRETVNQVTNTKSNPSVGFCPADTIEALRKQTNDAKLLTAINTFCAKQVYGILSSRKIVDSVYRDYLLGLVTSSSLRYRIRLKLFIKRFLY